MTEKKQLPEQIASHIYKRPAQTVREKYEVARALQRVVTVPESDPSTAWNDFAQRQEQRRRARARPQRYVESAPRTYAQTGTWASSGRIRAVERVLPQYHSSPIPTRSGRYGARRSFWWKLLSMFAVVMVMLLAINFALTSNAFRIEQVSVSGTHNDALIQTIQSMGMRGQNIFLLDVAFLTGRIDALPSVASASLSKQWPNQLMVTVVERVPVLLWQTPRGLYSVDNQGIIIAQASETMGTDHLGTVVDITGQDKSKKDGGNASLLRPGMHLDQADVAFAKNIFDRAQKVAGLTTFKLQYDGTMYASVADDTTGQSHRGSYIIVSPDGWKAYLGGANDTNSLDNRLVELQQILLLAQKQQLNLATIDLRYGLRPVFTLKP